MFDGARQCIKLPPEKLDSLIREVKDILRRPVIYYKQFEKVVGRLRYAVIGLPAGKGLYAPFNRVMSMHPKLVKLQKHGAVHAVLLNWTCLLLDMKVHQTHVNELV